MLKTGTVTLGLNYWASHAATEMWSKWDAEQVSKDLEVIAEHGMELIRVFPLWNVFQPLNITKYCGASGETLREMRMGEDERPLPDTPAGRAGMSETMMEHFEEFADIAHKHGLKLIVSIMTAHMTGRHFVPQAMENRDLFTDPLALKWSARFYDYFVRRMKAHPAIFAWETGNEAAFTYPIASAEAAWVWTNYIHNTIRLADDSHPIIGVPVHGLNPVKKDLNARWLIADQAELSDYTNIHRYDLCNAPATMDGFNHLRNVLRAVAENRMIEDIGGKPCFIEETGTWRTTVNSLQGMGNATRNILWNSWADNCRGLLWWCSFDQEKFDIAPYNWGEWAGLEHGIFTDDRKAHPAAQAMKHFRHFLDSLPFEQLPPPKEDAVCLVDDGDIAYSSFVLARQAGINLKFQSTRAPLTDADIYFLPSVELRGGLSTTDWEALLEKVRNGATLYMSYEDCNLSRLKDVCGMEISCRRKTSGTMTYKFDGFNIDLAHEVEKIIEIDTADVLGEDINGNPVFIMNRYGKGKVYSLMFPIEKQVFDNPGTFEKDCWRVYRSVLSKEHLAKTSNSQLIITEHFFTDRQVGIILVNCSMKAIRESLEFISGWNPGSVYSDCDECKFSDDTVLMPPNSGMLIMLNKDI